MSLSRDENGQLTTLTDSKGGNPWLSTTAGAPTDLLVPSIFGQAREHDGYDGARSYSYDTAGRLSQVRDTPTTLGATCSTRTYAFDADSNRTSSTSYPADSTGACQSTAGAAGTTHSYDTADRLLPSGGDTGLVYDTFGRLTTVPAADVTGGANVTVGYYTNDMVQSQTQGSTTQSWTLNANGRLGGWTGTGSISKTNHYDNASSDSPAWIAETADSTQWTASITDLLGSLAATVNQAGTATYQYTDLHGDVVATASSTVNSGNPTATADYGEYGTNPASTTRYGWLGAKTRSSDDLGGLILMGVRLYNPTLGRFLQTDPVAGGSANAYDYVYQDPINKFDLDGRCWTCWVKKVVSNPIFQTVVTVGACSFGGAIGCAAASFGFAAYNSATRCSQRGWGSTTCYRGAAVDFALAAVPMKGLRDLRDLPYAAVNRYGEPILRGLGRAPLPLIAGKLGRGLARNTAIAGGTYGVGHLIHHDYGDD